MKNSLKYRFPLVSKCLSISLILFQNSFYTYVIFLFLKIDFILEQNGIRYGLYYIFNIPHEKSSIKVEAVSWRVFN